MYWSSWPRGFVALTPATHFWMFTSISFGSSPHSCSFTSATFSITFHMGGGGATCTESGNNLSNMWQSRFKICLAQLHSVTEMALKSLFCLVVDPGEGPRGPFPLPLLIFRPNWWSKENSPLPLSQGLDDLGFFILIRSLNNKCMTEFLWFVGLGPRKFRSRAIELGDQSVWTDTPADKARKVVLFI